MAVRRGRAEASVLPEAGFLLWWRDGGQQVLRLLSVGVEERPRLLLGQLHEEQLLEDPLPLGLGQAVAH